MLRFPTNIIVYLRINGLSSIEYANLSGIDFVKHFLSSLAMFFSFVFTICLFEELYGSYNVLLEEITTHNKCGKLVSSAYPSTKFSLLGDHQRRQYDRLLRNVYQSSFPAHTLLRLLCYDFAKK